MTAIKTGRWLLVALAIVGLVLAAPVVGAHDNESTADDAPEDGTATEWTTWMEEHVTDHMGADGLEWMESHMGVTLEEMGQHMADGDHDDHAMAGQGHC